ncbi:hypothetical protein Sd1012_0299 [Shigella dysenteriae 1012]|nr:hypothetical protein Sd1012_0299 [Shigella dysenteriae 1012]
MPRHLISRPGAVTAALFSRVIVGNDPCGLTLPGNNEA